MSPLRRALELLAETLRRKATAGLELELHELEALFALLVVGAAVGLPLAPPAATLRLLPHLDRELEALVARTAMAGDGLAWLAGALDVG